jgi:hypothetical protein
MIDVIVTMVTMESNPDETHPYPVTKVFRLEFEREEGFDEWMSEQKNRADSLPGVTGGHNEVGIVHVEQLGAMESNDPGGFFK